MKTVIFCHDTYYATHKNGNIYAYGAFPYTLWKERFLKHFDAITVIGRKQEHNQDNFDKTLDQSNGFNVSHALLPNINTPLKRLLKGRATYQIIKNHVAKHDGLIVRGPTEFGMMAAKAARATQTPYAVEMSGCAFDHTWHHGSLIGKLYAPIKYIRARHMIANASQVIYVTKHMLQKRYPTAYLAEAASNVDIKATHKDVLKKRLHRIDQSTEPLTIGMIGNYGNKLKGLKIALKAAKQLKKDGKIFTLRILGNGSPQKWQQTLKNMNLQENVKFDGSLPNGDPVLQWLDTLDIYIQPSFHEGLPRAVIEAMSRGLPCLVSNAGGTDELLPKDCIHKKGNHKVLYKKLSSIWKNNEWKKQQSAANFKTAKNYSKNILAPIRDKFWKAFHSKL